MWKNETYMPSKLKYQQHNFFVFNKYVWSFEVNSRSIKLDHGQQVLAGWVPSNSREPRSATKIVVFFCITKKIYETYKDRRTDGRITLHDRYVIMCNMK